MVIIGLFILGMLGKAQQRREVLKQFILYNLLALSMVTPPIFMLSLTTDIAYRRAFAGFTAILLVNAIFALNRELILRKLRLFIFSGLVLAQLFTMVLYVFDLLPATRGQLQFVFRERGGLPVKGGDPSLRFFEKLKKISFEGHNEIASLSLSQTQYEQRPFDTSALNLIAKKENSGLRFSYPAVFANLNEGYALLMQRWDYAILDVSTGNPSDDPYSMLTWDMIQKWNRKELANCGFEYVATIKTSSGWSSYCSPANDKTIILLQVIKNFHTKSVGVTEITASSCLFPSNPHAIPRYLMEEGQTIWHAVSPKIPRVDRNIICQSHYNG